MIKKRSCALIVTAVLMSMLLLLASGCSDLSLPDPSGTTNVPSGGGTTTGKGTRLSAVTGVCIDEKNGAFTVSWNAVANADKYTVTANGGTVQAVGTSVDLSKASNVRLPSVGEIAITITASGAGYSASAPTVITYTRQSRSDSNQLQQVMGIVVSITGRAATVSWNDVAKASRYSVKIDKLDPFTVAEPTINLYAIEKLTLPEKGTIKITIIAQGDEYKDSSPTSITHQMEGLLLNCPTITAFKNGIIEWKKIGAATYVVKVDGVAADVTGNSYDTKRLTKSVRIDISCKGGLPGDEVSVLYNYEKKTLYAPPVDNLRLSGDTLTWDAVAGAEGYNVVDLDFNAKMVTLTRYAMTAHNLVYGVFPVMPEGNAVNSAVVVPTDIRYLKGKGTETEPYLIETPFDFRAIDYYEGRYAEFGGEKNYYKITADLDYRSVSALDGESNMFMLRKPFFGVLDGDNKKLSNVYVKYCGGYWSMFDYICPGAIVKNLRFVAPEINNELQLPKFPINASIATIAYRNYGTVSGIVLSDAKYTASGGEVCGIVAQNFGIVSGCTVDGTFKQTDTGLKSQACYEMAGVVLENCSGGRVENNVVEKLVIQGTESTGEDDGKYNNVRTAAGVVSVNRSGGIVSGNSYSNVSMIGMLGNGYEFGGVIAYNAGTAIKGTATLGKFYWSSASTQGAEVTLETGIETEQRGKFIGKNDGTTA